MKIYKKLYIIKINSSKSKTTLYATGVSRGKMWWSDDVRYAKIFTDYHKAYNFVRRYKRHFKIIPCEDKMMLLKFNVKMLWNQLKEMFN